MEKMFYDFPSAADLAGFSLRHFRRIVEEENLPFIQIGRKFFLTGEVFRAWLIKPRERRQGQGPRKARHAS